MRPPSSDTVEGQLLLPFTRPQEFHATRPKLQRKFLPLPKPTHALSNPRCLPVRFLFYDPCPRPWKDTSVPSSAHPPRHSSSPQSSTSSSSPACPRLRTSWSEHHRTALLVTNILKKARQAGPRLRTKSSELYQSTLLTINRLNKALQAAVNLYLFAVDHRS